MKIHSWAWKILTHTALFAAIGALPNEAAAFLAGAKATGMAATGIAYPQDAFAGAYNPAGAVEVGDRFDIGFAWLRNDGHANVAVKQKPAIKNIRNYIFDSSRKRRKHCPNKVLYEYDVRCTFLDRW